jgi:hypothetical protein
MLKVFPSIFTLLTALDPGSEPLKEQQGELTQYDGDYDQENVASFHCSPLIKNS